MSLNRLRKLSNRRRILEYFKPGSGSNEPIEKQAIDAYVNNNCARLNPCTINQSRFTYANYNDVAIRLL